MHLLLIHNHLSSQFKIFHNLSGMRDVVTIHYRTVRYQKYSLVEYRTVFLYIVVIYVLGIFVLIILTESTKQYMFVSRNVKDTSAYGKGFYFYPSQRMFCTVNILVSIFQYRTYASDNRIITFTLLVLLSTVPLP